MLEALVQNELFLIGLFVGLVVGGACGMAYGVMHGRIQVFDAMRETLPKVESDPIDPAAPADLAAIRDRMREIELMDPFMGRDL